MSVPGAPVKTPLWKRAGGNGGRRGRIRRLTSASLRIPEHWRRPALWLFLLAVAFVAPFISSTGRFAADTKLPLWMGPKHYLLASLRVWQSSPYLGHEQHDGLLFPMATVVALLRGAGISLWVTERLWHGLLLFAAAGGMVVLVDVLAGRRVTLAQPVSAFAYAFNPYTLGFGLHGTGVFLPYALLPLLMAAWIVGLRKPRGWIWPALVALAFFAMGGGNGAPQVYVLVPLLAYMAWAVLVERSVKAGPAIAFGLKSALLAGALSLWWLVGLTNQGVANDIAFSEQPAVINLTSSFSESLRLLGFWGFYGVDRFGPWFPSLTGFFTSPYLVVSSFLVPAGAFAAAWLARWRSRILFVLLAVLGVVVMAGTYPSRHPTPFGRSLLAAYDHVPGASGLRTTYKFVSTLAMSIALLLGIGGAEAWRRMRERGGRSRGFAPFAAALVAAGLVANAAPMWQADLYPRFRTFESIPAYWQQAVEDLRAAAGDGRVYFAPGGLFAYYRWGGPVGGIAEANQQLPSVRRPALPFMERYGSDLLAALEQPFQLGERVPGATAQLLRRLGVRYVVLQNDLDFARSNTARPTDLEVLTKEPGLQLEAAYGAPGQNVPGSGALSEAERSLARAERSLPPVQVLTVVDSLPVIRTEGGPPLVVSGDAFGIVSAISAGLLGKDQPILYSADLTTADLAAAAADGAIFVVTDSNRRREWNFSAVRENYSYTLPTGQGGPSVGYDLFGGRQATETVARFIGAADVSASAYGSPTVLQPWYQPGNAFDGNPSTMWALTGFESPVGQWIEVAFDHPIEMSQITIEPYVGVPGTRQLGRVELEFSDGTTVVRDLAGTARTFSFAPRTSQFLRIKIGSVRPGPFGGPVGIREVTVPGLSVRQVLRLPTDLFDLARQTPGGDALLASSALDYLFERGHTEGALPDEEQGIDRVFEVPAERSFRLIGVVRLDPGIPDDELDRLIYGPTSIVATSSGRAANNPGARASQALDGDLSTGWTSGGLAGQWMQVEFPRRVVQHLSLLGFTDANHSVIHKVKIELSDGTVLTEDVSPNGSLSLDFAPRVLDSVRVTIMDAGLPTALAGGSQPPAGIRELDITGVRMPPRPSELSALRCYQGPGVELDGVPIAVQPHATISSLFSGGKLVLDACGGKPISLSPGEHELRISGVLQPFTATLRSDGSSATSAPATPPVITVSGGGSAFEIAVQGATTPFYLVIGQNVAPGWSATLNGRSLGRPLILDGYSAGWRVDVRGSYTIDVAYSPQSRQNAAFGVSAVALGAVAAILLVGWKRRRRVM